ncbi:uncharacterized protein N7483_000799 [Penicillium malachiteum]|uniref:uncharacterized protein n=1 Tax=Penicillium malachiteum TaxID=1324776 RepID=UPI0025469ECE|nr:uncharacterized protein N7483_000799 [Penicillium malachiteum]KAJ5735674.1 hypothetical protein N7483_000799 [Penicillium malachiteum]
MSSSFTAYDGTIVHAQGALRTLFHLIEMAEQQPNADALIEARIHETMNPLKFQFFVITHLVERMLQMLAGREPVGSQDEVASYAGAKDLIQRLLTALDEADKDTVNRNGPVITTMKLGLVELTKSGTEITTTMIIPNIFFHVSTTYAILRKEGVPLLKKDYLYAFLHQGILPVQ